MTLGYLVIGYGGTALALLFGIWAVIRGGWAERTGIGMILAGWFLTPVIQTSFTPGIPILCLDTGLAVALFIISCFSRRVWSILVTACLSANAIAHVSEFLAPPHHKLRWAHVLTSDVLGGLLVALCFAIAVWECGRLGSKSR